MNSHKKPLAPILIVIISLMQSLNVFANVRCTDFERDKLTKDGNIKVPTVVDKIWVKVNAIDLPVEQLTPLVKEVDWYLENCKEPVFITKDALQTVADNATQLKEKLKPLIEAKEREKASEEARFAEHTTASEDCQKNGFSSCYNGHKWGTEVSFEKNKIKSEFCPKPIISNSISSISSGGFRFTNKHVEDVVKMCDSTLKDFSLDSKLRALEGNECGYILLDNKIVGFNRWLPDTDERAFTLLKAELRKKYGAPQKTSSCYLGSLQAATEFITYETSSGLQVVLFRGGDISYVEPTTKLTTIVRYLMVPTLQKVRNELESKKETQSNSKEKSDLSNLKKQLEGL